MLKHNSSRYDSFSKHFQAKCSYLKKEINHMARINRAATRLVKGLGDPTYEERLKALKKSLKKKDLSNSVLEKCSIPIWAFRKCVAVIYLLT